MEFKTDAVFDALKSPLALVEDAERRGAFERYVEAARYPLERATFDLISQVVSAVDERVSGHIRLRLTYRPGALVLDAEPVQREPSDASDEGMPDWTAGDSETEKITIRIPAELKDLATQAATAAGLSANSWFVRSMARSLRFADEPATPPRPPRPPHAPEGGRHGKRLQGWYGGS